MTATIPVQCKQWWKLTKTKDLHRLLILCDKVAHLFSLKSLNHYRVDRIKGLLFLQMMIKILPTCSAWRRLLSWRAPSTIHRTTSLTQTIIVSLVIRYDLRVRTISEHSELSMVKVRVWHEIWRPLHEQLSLQLEVVAISPLLPSSTNKILILRGMRSRCAWIHMPLGTSNKLVLRVTSIAPLSTIVIITWAHRHRERSPRRVLPTPNTSST